MAQVLLISKKTYKEGFNNIGDCVVVVEDSHKFSEHEKDIFNIVYVKGSQEEVEAERLKAIPKKSIVKKTLAGWTTAKIPDDKILAEVEVWHKSLTEKCKIEKPPTHETRYINNKFEHNYSLDIENQTKITLIAEDIK